MWLRVPSSVVTYDTAIVQKPPTSGASRPIRMPEPQVALLHHNDLADGMADALASVIASHEPDRDR